MRQRVCQPELMDAPGLAPHAHRQALDGLERINRLSGTVGQLWRAIRKRVPDSGTYRILDVACGGGDLLAGLVLRAAKCGVQLEGIGCDISPTAAARAQERARGLPPSLSSRLDFRVLDCLVDPLPGPVDVATSSLFLHHLDEEAGVRLLQRLRETASCLLMDDLRRSRPAWWLAYLGTRLLSRSSIVHFDGPASVQAAYSEPELTALFDRAELTGVRITRHWPCRMLASWPGSN